MAIDVKTLFNKKFTTEVEAELDRRKGLASGVNRTEEFKKWNYNRYCFVSVATTGENALGELICSSVMTIGDGSINKQAGLDLYEDEEGIRKTLPTLKSVTLDCDGSSGPVAAAMWTAKIEFDLSTLGQLNDAEESFLRTGSEVKISFGWRGETGVSNSGEILGEVTNYGFSANKDGSFACLCELVSAGSSNSKFNLEGAPVLTPEELAQAKEKDADPLPPYPNIIRAIYLKHKEAFGLKAGNTFNDDVAADGTIVIKGDANEYALANIQESQSWLGRALGKFNIDTNDLFVPYITLGALIGEMNSLVTGERAKPYPAYKPVPKAFGDLNIVCNKDVTIGAFIPEMFSSDPTKILFGGEMANYGKAEQANKMLFGETLSEFDSGGGFADLSKMYLSIPMLLAIFSDLKIGFKNTYTEADKKDSQTPPAVKDFLNEIFKEILEKSGGLYDLGIYQNPSEPVNNLLVINKRIGYNSGDDSNPYSFKVIGEESIIRDMSLSTEFNAKLQAAAISAARTSGQSPDVPKKLFEQLYANCKGKAAIKPNSVVEKVNLSALKQAYGAGFDEATVEDVGQKLKSYLIQSQPGKTKSEFGSVPYLINLSVTLDGIFGIPYFGRFTVDRLPAGYSADTGTSIFFTVTKINHSFDGQGDWSTQIEGVMNVKTT